MKNREFLQLAHVFDPTKHSVGGWFYSTKLDGQRAFWDGGLTRGIPCTEIPFANVEKHDRFLEAKVSTGLWSRYGQPIAAPDWWLDKLPKCFLDGELYAGIGKFQYVMSVTKDHHAGEGWKNIDYCIFGAPGADALFQDGRINNTNYRKIFTSFYNHFIPTLFKMEICSGIRTPLMSCIPMLETLTRPKHVIIHPQTRLPFSQSMAIVEIEKQLDTITSAGGEGLMLAKPEHVWEPFRTSNLLKVKPNQDSEGVIIGYTTGKLTDKGSKLLGLMGNMILQWNNVTFELSGFTDDERRFESDAGTSWACANPGHKVPDWVECQHFKRGDRVTFKYRELTVDGVPKEARYWRKHG